MSIGPSVAGASHDSLVKTTRLHQIERGGLVKRQVILLWIWSVNHIWANASAIISNSRREMHRMA